LVTATNGVPAASTGESGPLITMCRSLAEVNNGSAASELASSDTAAAQAPSVA
jgi:hypothetical protein